jgi:tetratricopeptide (TPR) repeat protein
MNWKILGWALLAGMVSTHAGAVESWQPVDAEFASLPPFCKVKMQSDRNSPEYKAWESTLGKDFLHTHHYCVGLNFINRYYRSRSKQDKIYNLDNALDNMTYMVEHASPDYSLMPDVYLNRGLAYSLMNRKGEAVADMIKAIELDPQQVKAYNVLADFYAGTRQQGKALETVTDGLRHAPDAKSLQRRYKELGGKLPYPEPLRPAPAAAAGKPAPEPAGETPATPASAAGGTAAPTAAATSAPVAPAKIGTPKNPYCRFCPD